MPALQPQAAPDKAMTFDLQALQPAAPTATSQEGPPATTAQPGPVAQDPDFAQPQGPWVGAQPPAPSNPWAALASQHAQARPSAPPPQQGPKNPWAAAMQSQQGAAQPSVVAVPPVQQSAAPAASSQPTAVPTPVQSASVKGPPVAPASSPAGSPPAASNPPAPAATPAQRQCFTNAEGLKICYMDDEQHKNTTDVHKEHGVNDYHNQYSSGEKEAIQGHVLGNNVTASLNDLGQPQKDQTKQDGSTAFQGQSDETFNHQHDIHKDNATYSDHDTTTSSADQDWKSSHKGKDGSKDMAEINRQGDYNNTSDTKIDGQGKDELDVENWRGSDDHRFVSDKPGTKDDSSLVWDEDEEEERQREEWTGRDGVYDLHEESRGKASVKASVDGEQGWAGFEQEMRDFDTVFNGDQAWKSKMKDLGLASASPTPTAAAVAGPSAAATGAVVKRGVLPPAEPMFETDEYWRSLQQYLKDFYAAGEVDGFNKRQDVYEDLSCREGETQLHCLCRNNYRKMTCKGVAIEPDIEEPKEHDWRQSRVQQLADGEGEKAKRDLQGPAKIGGECQPGDTAFQCICRRSTDHISCAMAWPPVAEDDAKGKMLLQARGEAGNPTKFQLIPFRRHKHDDDDDDKKDAVLESRAEEGKGPKIRIGGGGWFRHHDDDDDDDGKKTLGSRDVQENPWKQTWDYWEHHNELEQEYAQQKGEEFKKLQKMANEADRRKKGHGHVRRFAGLPAVDYADLPNGNAQRLADMPLFGSSAVVVRGAGAGGVGVAGVAPSTENTSNSNENNANMEKLSTVVLVCMVVLVAATVGVLVSRRVSRCLKNRKERRTRQASMQEIEGLHVVEFGRNGWQGSQQG